MLKRPELLSEHYLCLAAHSGKRLPEDCSLESLPEHRYGSEAKVFFVPDSALWHWICCSRVGFRLLGKWRLQALIKQIKRLKGVRRIALFVHKKRSLQPMCAIANTLVEAGICDWSELRIMLLTRNICEVDNSTLSNLEINRACELHRVPLGVIADSRHDPETDPDREVRRLFKST